MNRGGDNPQTPPPGDPRDNARYPPELSGPLPRVVAEFLAELPDAIEGMQFAMNGYLEIAMALEVAAASVGDEHDQLKRALRRTGTEVRRLCHGSQRTLNELRRIERVAPSKERGAA